MDKKFEMKVILFENDALEMATKCNGANGLEVITVLSEIANTVAERIYPDEAGRNHFIYDLVSAILTRRKEEDRI